MSVVKLKFEADDGGFLLKDTGIKDVNGLSELEELEREFFEASTAIDEKGRVRYFHFELWKSPEQLKDLIKSSLLSKIPGLYVVPELNLENVTFKEIIRAVAEYYRCSVGTESFGRRKNKDESPYPATVNLPGVLYSKVQKK